MKEVTLIRTKDAIKTHTLTVSISDGQLVFTAGDYYPPVEFDSYRDEGRERDDFLIIDSVHKAIVLQRLLEDLPTDSQAVHASDLDTHLLQAVQHIASLKPWRSLAEIEEWLMGKRIPFKKNRWLAIG